jgi:hypothetical protein
MIEIAELWHWGESKLWDQALDRYWKLIRPANETLEREMENLDLLRLRNLDEQGWYDFLRDEYFRWKYTAANRYATTTRNLKQYVDEGKLQELYRIKECLLSLDHRDITQGLAVACKIKGLGTAGASGLLSLMYPQTYATVDQFVVKALREVDDLPEAALLKQMNPMRLTIKDGVLLIQIMGDKAADNNRMFQTADWTPRKIDKVLWTYGRKSRPNSGSQSAMQLCGRIIGKSHRPWTRGCAPLKLGVRPQE